MKRAPTLSLPDLPNVPPVEFNHHIQRDLGSSGVAVPQHSVHEVLQCLRKKVGSVNC